MCNSNHFTDSSVCRLLKYSWHHCMAGYGDFPTLAGVRQYNSIYEHVMKNCSLPRCRSKCEDSNCVYLKFVGVIVSLLIAFKAVSVLRDHFDEDLGRRGSFNASYFNSSTPLCHCCWRYGGSWQWSGIGLLHVFAYEVSQCVHVQVVCRNQKLSVGTGVGNIVSMV